MMFSDNAQKNKLEILGKLTASLAHEMRNPLSAIKLNLEYMKMSSDNLPDEFNDSLQDCIEGAGIIENLIENILTFSRKNKNGVRSVSINSVTDKAVELTLPKAHKRRIEISKNYTSPLPDIEFNYGSLLQIFLNLIGNAVEACEDNTGRIQIRTGISENSVIWEITDNGVGIEEGNKDKIFGEFFTNKDSGTGLGLTVCQALLEEHNAKLSFKSKFGEGSTFLIKFDRAELGKNENA